MRTTETPSNPLTDVAWLRESLADLLGIPVDDVQGVRRITGGDVCLALRVFADGRYLFAKVAPAGDAEMFPAEVAGLAWLADGLGAASPSVVAANEHLMVLEWVVSERPKEVVARRLGKHLAELHSMSVDAFGQAPPGAPASGRIGSLPLSYGTHDNWAQYFAQERMLPYMNIARDAGSLTWEEFDTLTTLAARLYAYAGPDIEPRKIHGDLWSGNIVWGRDGQARLVDPAAHGGHPETDLAMLHLFGAPHLDALIDSYQQVTPLPEGWQDRIALHQIYPLLVHAALFGGEYGPRAVEIARHYLKQ